MNCDHRGDRAAGNVQRRERLTSPNLESFALPFGHAIAGGSARRSIEGVRQGAVRYETVEYERYWAAASFGGTFQNQRLILPQRRLSAARCVESSVCQGQRATLRLTSRSAGMP